MREVEKKKGFGQRVIEMERGLDVGCEVTAGLCRHPCTCILWLTRQTGDQKCPFLDEHEELGNS